MTVSGDQELAMNVRWKITGYDSLDIIFETEAVMSVSGLKDALRLLAAKGISEREIVEACTKGTTSTLLEVRFDAGEKPGYSAGEGIWYTARPIPKKRGKIHAASPIMLRS